MNERIRELAEKAGTKFPLGGFPNYDCFDCEQFAELIVRECVDAAEEAQADFYIVHNIKSRFGIEE